MEIERAALAGNHIVVGIDGSKQSQLALRWAAYLARISDSTLEAVVGWQPVIGAAGAFGYVTIPEGWNPAEEMEKALVGVLDQVFGAERPALGSVSSACAEHATCPVLVVHGDNPPPYP